MPNERKRIKKLEDSLAAIGPMLPGGITEQWNVCGKAGCKCKDPKNPKRHGPYFQLSFTIGGKSSSMFIKREDVARARTYVKNHARFKALTAQLLEARIAWARNGGLSEGSDG